MVRELRPCGPVIRAGGVLFEDTGSYDAVWWISIALGVLVALIRLPMGDRPVERLRQQAAAA